MKTRYFLALSLLSVFFYTCKSQQSNIHAYTEAQDSITAKKGDTFSIELSSNITTGFSWQLLDSASLTILQLKEKKYLEPAEKLAGKGGSDVFTFVAQETGSTTITFVYKRPWESTENKRKAFQITVK